MILLLSNTFLSKNSRFPTFKRLNLNEILSYTQNSKILTFAASFRKKRILEQIKTKFSDMFGNMEEMQQQMKAKLAAMTVEAEVGDGAIKVQANAAREILNISIDKSKLDWEDEEQVEDLMMVALNRVLALAVEKEAAETQNMLKDMLPPGMGGLSDLFG